MKYINEGLILAAAVLLTVGVANAEETVVTSQSVNADGTTTTTTRTYYYTDFDANNNGIIDSAEFPKFVYNRWDRNRDGFVTDDEWKLSTVRWYPNDSIPGPYTTYKAWDIDGDGRIDQKEFDAAVGTTKLYSSFDANSDSTIGEQEYADSTFRIYDSNNDGQISRDEWRNAY